MLCSLTKRFISRREDTGRALPVWAQGHLRRCPKCREFDEFCASLKDKAKVGLEVPSRADEARDARLLSALKAGAPRRTPAPQSWGRRLVPAAAVIALLATVTVVSIRLAAPPGESLPRLGEVISPEQVAAFRAELISVEGPLKKEKDALDDVLGSAVKYLVARLDPGFGE